jgi:hypothetical protein
VATSRLRGLFWRVADDLDYLWTLATLRILDWLAGLLPETPADQQRERDHERIKESVSRDQSLRRLRAGDVIAVDEARIANSGEFLRR